MPNSAKRRQSAQNPQSASPNRVVELRPQQSAIDPSVWLDESVLAVASSAPVPGPVEAFVLRPATPGVRYKIVVAEGRSNVFPIPAEMLDPAPTQTPPSSTELSETLRTQ